MRSDNIKIFGQASGKYFYEMIFASDLNKTLLNFLSEKGYPIASSCKGQGVCAQCRFNENLLSCQINVSQILDYCRENSNYEVKISYL